MKKLLFIIITIILIALTREVNERLPYNYNFQPDNLKNNFRQEINSIVEKKEEYKYDFWLKYYKNDLQKLILNYNEIKKINKNIQQHRNIDITRLETYTNEQFKSIIHEKIINKDCYYIIKDNLPFVNLKKLSSKNISYAINISQKSLKSIPQTTLTTKTQIKKSYDPFLDIGLNFAEPLAIVHYTNDGKWAFVLTKTGSGWVRVNNIAFVNKETFMQYINIDKSDFVIVTQRLLLLFKFKTIRTGTKLLLKKEDNNYFYINFPSRDKYGKLKYSNFKIRKFTLFKKEKNTKINKGFLLYKEKNLLRQIFKYKNMKYGWGTTYEGRDCDGYMISRIFSVFGFDLPQKSFKLQESSTNFKLNETTNKEELNKLLDSLKLGDLIYVKDYALVYIGKYNNEHYVLHAMDFSVKKGKEYNKMKIVVDTLNRKRRNGKKAKDTIVSITSLR